jgi:phage gpG-like protein
MFSLTIEQTGIEEAINVLTTAQRLCTDPITPAKRELTDWVHQKEARQFSTEGGAGQSGRWQRLSPGYARWKAIHYPGAGILERTGRLMRSLLSRTGDSIERSSIRLLELGTSVHYARYHQRGEGLPKRPPIDITNRDAAEIAAIIRRKFVADLARVRKAAA